MERSEIRDRPINPATPPPGFGLRGTTVADISAFGALMRDYEAQGTAEIWNVPISDPVTSPAMRRLKAKGHGVM
jgi:hypothetical protein